MIKGSCLCGSIVYQAQPIPEHCYNCHCSRCRKAHGADHATQLFADGSSLEFIQGEDLVSEYQWQYGIRAFCSQCGSRLMNYAPNKAEYLSVALACVDSEHDYKPVADVCTDDKAPWYSLDSELPKYPGLPEL